MSWRQRRHSLGKLRRSTAHYLISVMNLRLSLVPSRQILLWLTKSMRISEQMSTNLRSVSKLICENVTFLIKTLFSPKRKNVKRLAWSWPSMESLRNSQIKSKVTRLKLRNFRNLFINLRKTSKSMVLKLLKLTPSTINAWSKSSSKIIWSPNCRKRTSKLRVVSSNSRTFMRQSDQIATFIPRICSKPQRKLLS